MQNFSEDFGALVRKNFKYLEDKFNFKFKVLSSEEVICESLKCHLRFILEKTQIFIDLKPATEPYWSNAFDLGEIVRFKNPKLNFEYNLDSDFLIHPKESLENELSRLAPLLWEYCEDILKGDFSSLANMKGS